MANEENERQLRYQIECAREDIVKHQYLAVMAEKHGLILNDATKSFDKISWSEAPERAKMHLRIAAGFAEEMVGNCAALGIMLTNENWKRK